MWRLLQLSLFGTVKSSNQWYNYITLVQAFLNLCRPCYVQAMLSQLYGKEIDKLSTKKNPIYIPEMKEQDMY